MRKFVSERGFTLIELLVAVSIFILLTSIAIVSYRSVNQSARDGRRQSDLEQVRAALEICRADNDVYPSGVNYSTAIATLITGNYLNQTPADPRPSSWNYYYNSAAGVDYLLCAYLEGTGFTSPCTITGTPSCLDNDCNYCVCSP